MRPTGKINRIANWVLRALAVAWLVAFLAVIILWIRSYQGKTIAGPGETIARMGHHGFEITSMRGEATIETYWGWPSEHSLEWIVGVRHLATVGDNAYRVWANNTALGYQIGSLKITHGTTTLLPQLSSNGDSRNMVVVQHEIVQMPYWMLIVFFMLILVWPAVRFSRVVLARHRLRKHLCVACGYDLRASPGRCPECGTPDETPPLC
jgi:hypothetical protein